VIFLGRRKNADLESKFHVAIHAYQAATLMFTLNFPDKSSPPKFKKVSPDWRGPNKIIHPSMHAEEMSLQMTHSCCATQLIFRR
jgi:hypothetical protein